MIATEAIPLDWISTLRGGKIGIGYDVATTDKKTSNPSAITVLEDYAGMYWQRFLVRFKSADPEAAMQVLETILPALPSALLSGLAVDSSNEKYHAKNVQKRFRRYCRVHLVAGGESILWEREKFSCKTLLGQLYVSAFEDNKMAIAPEEWVVKDHRLVKNHAGSFATDVDEEGNHGDTFDSGKLALWCHLNRAKLSAAGVAGVQVGGTKARPSDRKSLDRVVTLAKRRVAFGIPGHSPNKLTG